MKVNELQIEDFVMYNGSICRVYSLSMPFPRKEERYNDKAIITLWSDGFIDALEEEIDPIPLTQEILEKNGFRRLYQSQFYNLRNGFSIAIGNEYFTTSAFNMAVTLYYVHELQHALRLCGLNELVDNVII